MRRAKYHPGYLEFKWFCDLVERDLKLDSLDIRYAFRPYRKMAGRATWCHTGAPHQIRIASGQAYGFTLHTIAHELRHIWQLQKGILIYPYDQPDVIIWRSTIYSQAEENRLYLHDQKGYDKLPWEVDANRYATRAIKKLLSK